MYHLSHLRLLAVLALSCAWGAAALAVEPVYHPATTRKMFQLTGDFDRPLQRATASLTETRSGMRATDLGSSFEHKGILYFLFGDTNGRAGGADSLATSSATSIDTLSINVPRAPDGKFLVITVPGISQGGMEVPSGGISLNGKIYIVCTTDWYDPNMERSVLARSDDDGHTWTLLYDLSAADPSHDMTNARFINVSMAEVDAADYPGLPWASGKVALIWGSGAYRASNVCLAAIPSAEIETSSSLRYMAGLDGGGAPLWSTAESNAAYLFVQPDVGEFSVAWVPQVGRWIMLYNAGSPRGITMRTAAKPWGPWSGGSVIMDPWADGAYGRFLHIPLSAHWDDFQDPGREEVWGGEYGPYLIPRLTTGDATRCRIYYTMSTWNPYQAVVMGSEIGVALPPEPSQTLTEDIMPGDANWQKSPGTFFENLTHNSVPHITTYTTPDGAAATGWMWRWLPRDTLNQRLQFTVYGGNAEVMVLSGGADIPVAGATPANIYSRIKSGEFGDVVLCTWGHDANDIDVPNDWDLRPFDRANLKAVVIDHRTAAPWGFVGVSRMTLVRTDDRTPTPTPTATSTPTATATATPTPTRTPRPADVPFNLWFEYE